MSSTNEAFQVEKSADDARRGQRACPGEARLPAPVGDDPELVEKGEVERAPPSRPREPARATPPPSSADCPNGLLAERNEPDSDRHSRVTVRPGRVVIPAEARR